MAAWEDYKEALRQANKAYVDAATKSWEQYLSEVEAALDSPRIEPNQGRVTAARALARFYSRNDKIVMAIAAAEQEAFDAFIKPLRADSKR